MRHTSRIGILVMVALVAVCATPASAQTRFAIEAGPLMPFSDFGDGVDTSAWIGARMELQQVNALGQVASLSFVAQGGYSDLELDGSSSASASIWTVGVGARVYSLAIPFFLHGGLNYMSTDLPSAPGGADPSTNAFGPTLGAGVNFDVGAVFFEVEGRLHIGLGAGDDEVAPRYATITAALGLPF